MSEMLSSQDLKVLNEIPSTPAMGELRKMATLHDIPLAEGESLNTHQLEDRENISQQEFNNETEHKLKTNSLKRFFHLSPKKKSGDDYLNSDQSNKGSKGDNEDKKDVKQSLSEYKRFKMGFGRFEANMASSKSNSKMLQASFSKANLKSSLSSYWNTVFKQKKSKKSSKSNIELAEKTSAEPDDNSENQFSNAGKNLEDNVPEENSVLEEIQSLKISEEFSPK